MGKGKKSFDEVHLNAFTTKVLGSADQLYRFVYATVLDLDMSFKVVRHVIDESTNKIDMIYGSPEFEVRKYLFKECWVELQKHKATSDSTVTKQLGKLAKLPTETRAAVILTDCMGFRMEEAAGILDIKGDGLINDIVEARQALIS